MHPELAQHLEALLSHYTIGPYYDILIRAKNYYFNLTGVINEEDSDFEHKMDCFNDWYLLQYLLPAQKKTALEEYLEQTPVEEEVKDCLQNFNYSIFEYLGERRQVQVIRDIVQGKKTWLAKEHQQLCLIKGDFFIGRLLSFKGSGYLMKGYYPFPPESKRMIKKEVKKVRKLKDPMAEVELLLKIESLNTKCKRYGHVDIAKIFVFE